MESSHTSVLLQLRREAVPGLDSDVTVNDGLFAGSATQLILQLYTPHSRHIDNHNMYNHFMYDYTDSSISGGFPQVRKSNPTLPYHRIMIHCDPYISPVSGATCTLVALRGHESTSVRSSATCKSHPSHPKYVLHVLPSQDPKRTLFSLEISFVCYKYNHYKNSSESKEQTSGS